MGIYTFILSFNVKFTIIFIVFHCKMTGNILSFIMKDLIHLKENFILKLLCHEGLFRLGNISPFGINQT